MNNFISALLLTFGALILQSHAHADAILDKTIVSKALTGDKDALNSLKNQANQGSSSTQFALGLMY